MGPLAGIRVLEVCGIGPIPFVGMMLSDMGAEVIRVERIAGKGDTASLPPAGILERNRKRIGVDLKAAEGVALVKALAAQSDVLLEGFRPGVMERLGLGPDECLTLNPRLIYGRMTGWGQQGPMANLGGHDLNYISTLGVTAAIGTSQRPVPPLNLVGDYGGGAMTMTIGVCAALHERNNSGLGQVIDTAMIDGAALLMNTVYELAQRGEWRNEREANLLDGGAHFYAVYETSDGKFMSVGAAEPHFYRLLLVELGIGEDEEMIARQWESAKWPEYKTRLASAFRCRTRAEWASQFEGKDACCTPVLELDEVASYPHHKARGLFVKTGEFEGAAPAPRFSRTVSQVTGPASDKGECTDDILALAGIGPAEAAALKASGAVL